MIYLCQTTNFGNRDLSELKSSIPNLQFIVDDGYHSGFETFIRSLEFTDEPCVRIEDDIELCNNFVEVIENIISRKPDVIINFFRPNANDFRINKKETLRELTGKWFSYNQCTYYPQGIASKLAKWLREHREQYKEYDDAMRDYFVQNDIHFYQYCPNIVNHKSEVSLIDKNRSVKHRVDKHFKKDI